MFCRAIAAVLLVSGFYTDAHLNADKRVIVQCAALGTSCDRDLGYIDWDGRFHPAARTSGAWQH